MLPLSGVAAPPSLKQQAEGGDAEAAYRYGKSLLPDVSKASIWLKRAAQQGRVDAAITLARLYESGEITPPSDHAAKDLYALAFRKVQAGAKAGDARAMARLGELYAHGKGAPKDTKKALEWLEQAVTQGEAHAQLALGRLTIWGGVPGYPPERSLALFQAAADAGLTQAWLQLGLAYAGAFGGRVNHARSFHCFEQAAKRGNDEALRQLGIAYLTGLGVKRDEARGLALLEEAASQNNPEAKRLLRINAFFTKKP